MKPLTADWLNTLAAIVPPQGLVLVGAGGGGLLTTWVASQPAPALLIEGDPQRYALLNRSFAGMHHLAVQKDVVAPTHEPVDFYRYSIPDESGLAPYDVVSALWPHIEVQHTIEVANPITLNDLALNGPAHANWLLVDTPYACELLESADDAWGQADVLICRAHAPAIVGWTHKATEHGHHIAAGFDTQHPHVRHVVLVRDVALQRTQSRHILSQLNQQLAAETQSRQQEAAAKADALKQRDELAQAQSELQQTMAQVQQAQAGLQQKLEAQTQAKAALQQQLEAETQARQQQAIAKTDALKQRDELAKANAELQQTLNSAEEKLKNTQETIAALELKNTSNEKLILSLKSTLEQAGGLGEMIKDLEPFFYGRRVTYVDVGAYIGDVFLKLANSNIKIREAHLFEPNANTFQELVEKTPLTAKSGSIHHYQMALGNSEGILNIRFAASMSKVTEGEAAGVIANADSEATTTPVTTLDKFIEHVTDRQIHLLKIDVEGFEESVLRGASSTMQAQLVDVVVIEVGFNPSGTQQCHYRVVDDLLGHFGYRLFKVYDQVHEWISDSPILRRANFVYMSEQFAKSNPYRLTHELHKTNAQIEKLKQQLKKI
jgi:FkbM family methyltransferase